VVHDETFAQRAKTIDIVYPRAEINENFENLEQKNEELKTSEQI
jgi:hypothetical protein